MEWTTRTETRRTVSGSTIDEKSAVEEVTEWKNHANAAMAPTATRTMAHPGGWVRVR